MTAKKPSKTDQFDAFVRVTIDTTVPLSAKTFEDALQEAQELKERDVVSFDTDYNDGRIEVTAVLKRVGFLED